MNKTWSVIISIIITAIVVGGVAYYYLNNKAENEKADLQNQIDELEDQILDLQSKSSETNKSDESETATEEETADWETYSNEEYGFSFKYPIDFKVTLNEGLPGGPELSINPQNENYEDNIDLMNFSWHLNIGEETNLSSFVSAIKAESKIDTKVGKYSAIETVNINGSSIDEVVFEVDGTISSFSSHVDMLLGEGEIDNNQAQEYANIFTEILKSFKYSG